MKKPLEGVAFRVVGRVQGVGFRWFGCTAAEQKSVTGWIRNRSDGAVEGEAFGPPDSLDEFLSLLRRGPSGARVDRLDRAAVTRDAAPDRFETRF